MQKAFCNQKSAGISDPLKPRSMGSAPDAGLFFREFVTKTLNVMKLTTFFILAVCLQVSAGSHAQTITYSGNDISLPKVFKEIKRQTGYAVVYNAGRLKKAKPVDIQATNMPLAGFLQTVLDGQPFGFNIENTTIFIYEKRSAPPAAPAPAPQQPLPPVEINGHVSDKNGDPLVHASITIKGKGGTVTDARGNFTVKGLNADDEIVISYLGYQPQTFKIGQRTYFPVTLQQTNDEIDQVQIIAYGTQSRRFAVGSVSTVTAEDIAKQPVSNVALALQGRVPGLLVTPTGGGIPGATVHLQVRGQNTLANSASSSTTTSTSLLYNQPLIIVDGIPTSSQNNNQVQLLNSFIAGNGLSPLNYLNPADIESISVLKDADATSIYGSQGANGVMIITTKRGHSGKTQFNVNVNTGPNSPTDNLQMLNTQQYLQLRHEALQLDGISLSDPNAASTLQDLLNYDTTKYTNWAKKFFNQNPMNTDVHLSLSGGKASDSYILSAGYTRSAYNIPGDFSDDRLTFHSGAHHSSDNRKFTLDFGTDFGYDKNNSSSSASIAQAMALPPDYPDMFTPSGDLVWNYNGVTLNNMFASTRAPYSMTTFSLNSNIKMDYEIISGLKLGVLAGYSRGDNKEYGATPKNAQNPSMSPSASANFSQGVSQTIDIEPQLNYRKYFGKGVLTALIGGTYKKTFGYSNQQNGYNYPDDALLNSIQGAQTKTNLDNNSIYKYVGGFARFNYIYDSKYIVNLTGRRDGSSNFGPNRQFGSFGSVGLGWIFSEESGFKKALPFISFGKLSGDYGTNGTDGVAAYMYQPFYSIYNSNPTQFQGSVPLIPKNLYNPDYTWSSKHSLNLSIDIGLFKDRILLNTTWYQNRTGNQLTSYPLSYLTGFSSVVENMNAKVQDRGLEITLSTKNIQHKDFSWTSTFNISYNRNKLLSFPGLESSPYSGTYQIGKSTSVVYRFKYAGINDTTGLFQFYKGDGKTITSAGMNYSPVIKGGDNVPVASGEPDFYGGLGNTFTYKGLSLSLFFEFKKSYTQNYLAALYNSIGGPGYNYNMPTFILGKVWLNPDDKGAVLQRPTSGAYSPSASPLASQAQRAASYFSNSSGAFSNNTYLRLKNVSVSYQLQAKWVKAMHMTNFNVFLNAQNVLTFTNYKYGDPELPGQLYGIPTQRILSGGLNFSF